MDDHDNVDSAVLAPYAGKSVIMLCNGFDYFLVVSILSWISPSLCESRRKFFKTQVDLLLGSRTSHSLRNASRWIRDVVFPIAANGKVRQRSSSSRTMRT
jgi:hypothetical protein